MAERDNTPGSAGPPPTDTSQSTSKKTADARPGATLIASSRAGILRGNELDPSFGRLLQHGRAPYQNRPDQDLSYFVRILTNRGKRRTFWGKDLDRALNQAETRPQTGDLIGVRRIAREPITRMEKQRDAQGRVMDELERQGFRARWQVEKVQFFSERARRARLVRDAQVDVSRAVRSEPALRSSFMSIAAAEKYATQTFKDPQERERFMTHLREVLASSIHRGEPVPDIRLRDRQQTTERQGATPPKKRDEPTR